MFLSINNNKLAKLFASFLLLIGILFAYTSVSRYIEPLNKEILEVAISDIVQISNSITQNIVEVSDENNFVKSILTEDEINKQVKVLLKTLQTDNIKYVYTVFQSRDKYRYLLDVSHSEQSESLESFLPLDKTRWDSIYKDRDTAIILHNENKSLGFTYLKPIIIQGVTVAILAIDYSRNKLKSIEELKSKIQIMILSILFFAIVLFLGLIFQTYRTFFLKEKMFTDSLTSLNNRHYLKHLQENIDLCKYYILLIDIDLFKRINDSYGHNAGDFILIEFSKKLLSFKRKKDFLIRHGGEEFLLMLHKDIENVEDYAQNIRLCIEKHKFIYEKTSIPMSISIGLYLNEDNTNKLNVAIHKSDQALYEAKRTGRNKVVISHTSICNIEIDNIRDAIKDNLLFCQYHSIIDIRTNEISHYEALVRIKHTDKIIYPNSFLPSIENTFLYTQMTKKIFLLNIEKLKEYKGISISINFSPEDLLNNGVIELLTEYKRYSSRILIEILETQNISYNLLNVSLKNLRSLGYSICIDDFGSGYSNFTHLLQMDINYLKLDANLIKDLATNYKTYIIVESIVHICKKSNIKVIAEYVESLEILKCLKELDIEYAQGYYFSKPQAIENYFQLNS